MKLKDNILSKWWWSWVTIPIFTLVSRWIFKDYTDRLIYDWFIIITVSLIIQIFFHFKIIKSSATEMHLFYIVISLIASMFFTYILYNSTGLHSTIEDKVGAWLAEIVFVLAVTSIIFVLKMLIWWILKASFLKKHVLKQKHQEILDQNQDVISKYDELKFKYDELKMKNEKLLEEIKNRDFNLEDKNEIKTLEHNIDNVNDAGTAVNTIEIGILSDRIKTDEDIMKIETDEVSEDDIKKPKIKLNFKDILKRNKK
ncbi:MAG: cell division protein ZapB [Mycoplasma sp.]|nr:cell division protein ZapB [Mycoplasma sp.]